ncbi:hypothetical protein HC928_10345 [bacterium]|nr:hypothetical protein [bacterium]
MYVLCTSKWMLNGFERDTAWAIATFLKAYQTWFEFLLVFFPAHQRNCGY